MCPPFTIFAIFESGMGRDIAIVTISMYCNPCCLGTGNLNSAQINIQVNPITFYQQPGNPAPGYVQMKCSVQCHLRQKFSGPLDSFSK